MKHLKKISIIGTLLLIAGILHLSIQPNIPEGTPKPRLFIVGRNMEQTDIQEKLTTQNIVSSWTIFNALIKLHGGYNHIQPGGYELTASPSLRELSSTLTRPPTLVWITIPEGLRKEQIAERLAEKLQWTDAQKTSFIFAHYDAVTPYNLQEGFYFPDTYLIPKNEAPLDIAKRMMQRFNDQYDTITTRIEEQNMRYDTPLKIASLIQREAGGTSDMPLIAGVIWNRLNIGMKLDIDATLQYARGQTDDGSWWSPIAPAAKKIDSPYNTYMYTGLPPEPICNPGMDAIRAALEPADTNCLFYLHDTEGQIHCSETYAQHLDAIQTYLR